MGHGAFLLAGRINTPDIVILCAWVVWGFGGGFCEVKVLAQGTFAGAEAQSPFRRLNWPG